MTHRVSGSGRRPASPSAHLSWLVLVPLLLTWPAAHAQLPAGTTDATQTAPADPDAGARAEASAALDHSDFPRAIRLLTALAEHHPTDAPILFDLAAAQDALSSTDAAQTAAAEASYHRAIAADPSSLESHLALGLLLARNGRDADARTELLAATTLRTGTPALKARAFRALAHVDQTQNPAEARDALLEALKLSPETPDDTLLSAALAERSDDSAAAEAVYRRTLTRSPNDPAATAALARLLLTQSKEAEAEPLLTTALAAHPGDLSLTSELAALRVRQQHPDQAAALLAPLYQQHPDDPDLGRLYARLLTQSGDFAAADLVLAHLLERAPGDGPLLSQRGDALIHLKRYADAQHVLTTALEHRATFNSPQDMAEAAGRLAFAASVNNDPDAVLQALAVRATVLPQSPSSLFLEATAHDKLHHLKQSREAYRQFLSVADGKYPDEEWEARHRLIALEHAH